MMSWLPSVVEIFWGIPTNTDKSSAACLFLQKSKVLSEKELAEGDSENEEAEVVIQYDDNSDEDVYSESEPSDNEAIASEEEDEDYALNSEDENGEAPQSDAEPDLSEGQCPRKCLLLQ